MSSPNQYPQLPPGVAPYVAGIASEFAAIRHGVEEAVRHIPPVITFPTPPPDDLNFVRPETNTAGGITIAAGWANFGSGFQLSAYEQLGTTRVFMRGVLSNVAGALAANTFYTIGTLPVGLRPAAIEMCFVICGDPITAGRLDIHTDGTMTFASQLALPKANYVSISDVTFSTL